MTETAHPHDANPTTRENTTHEPKGSKPAASRLRLDSRESIPTIYRFFQDGRLRERVIRAARLDLP